MKKNKLKFITALCITLFVISFSNIYAVTKTSIASGNWRSASTWSPSGKPGYSDNIIIATGYTVTLDSSVVITNITIQTGATLNQKDSVHLGLSSGPGTVYTNNGTHNAFVGDTALFFYNGIPVTCDGNGVINGKIELYYTAPNFLNTCNITINGDIHSNMPGQAFKNYGNLILNGNIYLEGSRDFLNYGSISIIGSSEIADVWMWNFGFFNITGNLNLYLPAYVGYAGQGVFRNYGTAIVEGDVRGSTAMTSLFMQEQGAIAKFGGQVFAFGYEGDLCTAGMDFLEVTPTTIEPNTIEYNGSIAQVIKSPTDGSIFGSTGCLFNTYSNLILSNTNIKTLSDSIIVNGNLTIKGNAQLDVTIAPYNIRLKGDWINIGTNSNPFNEQLGKVILSGNTSQNIIANLTVGETFYNLVMNHFGTGVTLVNNNINISDTLELINGIIHTGIYETSVTNNITSAIINHSTNSYINGNLKRNLLSTGGGYDFPVGNSTSYQLANVNITGAHTISNLLVKFSNLVSGTGLPLVEGANTFNTILNCGGVSPGSGNTNDGVWTITPDAGTANYNVTLYGRNYSNASISNSIVKRNNSSTPWSLSGTYVSSTGSEPLITSRIGFSTFGQFAVGVSNLTTSLINYNTSYNGINIYPNPAISIINIDVSNTNAKNSSVDLYDILGNRIKNIISISNNLYTINRNGLASGIYVLKVTIDENMYSKKIFFE